MRSPTTRGAILSVLALACPLTLFVGVESGELLLGAIVLGALLYGVALSATRLSGVGATRGRRLTSPVGLMLIGASILAGSPVANEIHTLVAGSGWEQFSLGEAVAVLGYVVLIIGAHQVLRRRTMAFQWEPVLDATLVTLWVGFVALVVIVEPLASLSQTSMYELFETAMFLSFALVVAWSGLRICLGGATRSWAFVLLVTAQFLVPLSELLFHAKHLGVSQRPAAAIGAIGLVTLVAAATSPDAEQLSVPARSDGGSYRHQAVAGLVLTMVGLLALVAMPGRVSPSQLIMLSLIGGTTLARMRLLSQRQQGWIQVNTRLRSAVERLMEQDELDDILGQAEATAYELLVDHRFTTVRIVANGTPERGQHHSDHSEFADDDFVARALESGVTQRVEFLVDGSELGGGRHFASRLAAPVSTGETSVVLVAETVPVLSQDEVAHLEMLMSSVALTLEASRSREETHDRRSNDRFRALVQDSNDIVALVDRTTFAVELVSPTLSRLLGYDETNALGGSPLACVHRSDREVIEQRLETADGFVAIEATDVRMRHRDGRFLWFAVSVRDLSEESEVSGLLFSFADIHDRKMTELQMAASENRYRTLVSNSSDVMLLVDDGVITYLTPNVERVFGYRAADLIGVRADAFLDDTAGQEVASLFDDDGLIQSGSDIVVALPTAVGGFRWAELTFLDPGLDRGEMMISIRDVTEQRRLEASLREQALHDPLTGLFNRASVYPELQRTLQRLDRHMTVGVLHLDLVDFKAINDSLGFAAGDGLLIDVATRLRSALRQGDTLARFNGDEFAIVTLCEKSGDFERLIERLQDVFDEPFVIDGRPLHVSTVIGAAQTRQRTESATRLLESAGIALQHAKSAKRGVAIFEEAMREAAAERFELASGMLRGIEQGEFYVVYQPLLDMATQKVSSVEALLRWQHPERGFVSPGVFIPIAEQSGAIIQLGRWVLQQACEQLVRWHEELPDGTGLSMSVNVSARQFAVEGEAERMLAIIEETGVDTGSLVIELTESVMLDDAELLRTVLDEFRALGIRVAVDDFGTGAAGLGHLRDVPFDIVKIDKSYIDGLGESEEAHLLITRVIELAHGLNANIVAEGIETPLQARLLKSMRCDYGQGFYLGRPMEPVQIEEWFAQGRAGLAAASIAPATRAGGAVRQAG